MNKASIPLTPIEKLGRINSIDLLQGIAVCAMVSTHVLLWYDRPNFLDQTDLYYAFFSFLAGFVAPAFLMLMGFNMRNSIARRLHKVAFSEVRKHLLKRGIFFLLIGFLNNIGMALLSFFVNPAAVIPWLLSWELFHIFGSTVLISYVIYEVVYQLKIRNILKGDIDVPIIILCSILLGLILLITILLQAIFSGVYSWSVLDPTQTADVIAFGEVADINESIQIIFARGPFSLFPFINFGVLGFLLASLRLRLSTEAIWRQTMLALGICFALIGTILAVFLRIPVVFPLNGIHMPSLSYVFAYWAAMILGFLVLLAIFDIKRDKDLFPYVMPVARLGSLTLTIYYVQNIPFFLSNSIIPNRNILTVLMALYIVFFMVVAYAWEKKKFKYSLEWFLHKLTN